jgi:lipopolysaccharide export LptBFGC system permease protein LptF
VNRWVRALAWAVAIVVAVVVLFGWVFPWVESRTQDPAVGAATVTGRV